jgi:hypothetical protein
MIQEYAVKLSEALRSDKYKKGTLALQRDGKFCCLGVLGDIMAPGKWTPDTSRPGLMCLIGEDGEKRSNYLPESLRIKCGMDPNSMDRLAGLNDTQCYTFPEIANYIDANWEIL